MADNTLDIQYVQNTFKVDFHTFIKSLKMSPNALGYIVGSISEYLLKKELIEKYDMEIQRIREKWEGEKHLNHHGDFYVKKNKSNYWYVLESKGIKSNSEKWHKLYNFSNLQSFLVNHYDKIPWIDKSKDIKRQVLKYIEQNLPKFFKEYSKDLYDYEEVMKYLKSKSKKVTNKSIIVKELKDLNRELLGDLIKERLSYLSKRIRVLETHFVTQSGSKVSKRTQATPRKDEFNIISIDLFLRADRHHFVYANPKDLEPSSKDKNHLQQNYIMGFIFIDEKDNKSLTLKKEWKENFDDVYNKLTTQEAVNEKDMQVDKRDRSELLDEVKALQLEMNEKVKKMGKEN